MEERLDGITGGVVVASVVGGDAKQLDIKSLVDRHIR
jgi:hypothetical protein